MEQRVNTLAAFVTDTGLVAIMRPFGLDIL